MKTNRNLINILLAAITLCISFLSYSANVDVIKTAFSQSSLDNRGLFKNELLNRAMLNTELAYGPYRISSSDTRMNRHRALATIILGDIHNVYISPNKPEWNEKTIAIKIPIRLGLVGYRLLAVHKNDLKKFSTVKTLHDFKKLKGALRSGWLTTTIFNQQGFDFIKSPSFDGLYYLLESQRVDYIPRAIYEVFDEIALRAGVIKNIVVEPTLALHIPTATYIYVSPTEPKLAKRIEQGINKMHESGELLELVNRYYGEDIKRANLKNRKIIHIENPFYLTEDQQRDAKYWFRP